MVMRNDIYIKLSKKGLVCGICGDSLEKEWKEYLEWRGNPKSHKRTKINLNIDHIIPADYFRGSMRKIKNDISNLQLSHKDCNNKKGNKVIHYPLSTIDFYIKKEYNKRVRLSR
jgi:5-methylcytosine-specific restriction endonuclease McrA